MEHEHSQQRRCLVLGNWKMHGNLQENAARLTALRAGAAKICESEIAVCVPFPYLAQTQAILQGSSVSWGAQDISAYEKAGAYTGDVAGMMLADFGARWVLVGHSERRTLHGESDDLVVAKVKAALAVGLTPVVCVGETLAARQQEETWAVIQRQLAPVLALGPAALARLVLAYEPIWAIGTGRTATPGQAQQVHAAMRGALQDLGVAQVRLLYGGSVTASSAADLFSMPDIDGALVGSASLAVDEFLRIAAMGSSAKCVNLPMHTKNGTLEGSHNLRKNPAI